jgi:hypothetical protein
MKARHLMYLLLLVTVFLTPVGGAAASRPDVTVNGGGMATFDLKPGGTTFAVGAHLREDGTASGHFNCALPPAVVISGELTSGEANPDGSVTFRGTGTIVDFTFGKFILIKGEPITVRLWEGGPGVGRFRYTDTVVDDFETVATGNIKITGNE